MIYAFLHTLESIFAWLIEASWQASVLVALVLLLQFVLRGRLNPRWHHTLWLLVIVRLMLPILPESALSLFQFAPLPPLVITETVTEPIFSAPAQIPAPVQSLSAPDMDYPFSAWTIFALVWFVGALGLFMMTWQVNRRFARHAAEAPSVTDPVLLKLAEAAQRELGLHRRLRIIESTQVQSPAIMGLFRPTLILPGDVRARFDDDELRFIFLHEFAHLKRGDLFLQWLVALLQIIHWFNPVLWYAFRRLRADREPATDALVLSCTGEASKESYGQVLVKLLEHYHARHSLPTLVGILEDKDQFKRRFSLIARFTRGAYGWSLLGVLLIGILSVACLTKSKAAGAPIVQAVQKSTTTMTEGPGKTPELMIRIATKIVQIDEDDYQAHRADIDDAVQKGDPASLTGLKSFHLLFDLPILTKAGEQGVVESVRVLPYPTAFAKQADGKLTPTDYKKQNLGVRFVHVPTFTNGQINIRGDLSITSLARWAKTGENFYLPSFHVREAPVSESFVSGQTKGFQVPGGAQMEPFDPTIVTVFNPDKPDASQNPKALRRVFFFLNAQAFHGDGRPLTSTNTSSPPVTLVQLTTSTLPTLKLPPGPTAAEMKAVEISQTPLMKALQSRQYDQARALLAQGADCNATDKMGSGALAFLISSSGNDGRFPIDILQTILARTRNPNPPVPLEFCTPPQSDPLLEVALMSAAFSNGPERLADNQQVVKLLLARGSRFTGASDDIQALLQAAVLDDLASLQQLVAKGTSPSAADGDGWTPLLVSVALDHQDMDNWLIDHGADVSATTRRGAEDPLFYATAHGDDTLVEKLIAKGAKAVLRGGDLWRAVDHNDQRLFDDLINAGAAPKQETVVHGSAGGKSWRQIDHDALFICIAKGQTAMALTLIDKGVDPEPANVFMNQNFAYWAVSDDRPQILQALLDHGANPLLKDDAGETPLSLAQKSHPDLVQMLQVAAQKTAPKSGTSTQVPDLNAQLVAAVQKGDAAAVQKLIDQGADPKALDRDGLNLLFYAGSLEVENILVAHGVTPNTSGSALKDAKGDSRTVADNPQ